MTTYRVAFPHVSNSGFVDAQYGDVKILEVRAKSTAEGGSGRIAVVDSPLGKRVIPYGVVTYAEHLKKTRDKKSASEYMLEAVETAQKASGKWVDPEKRVVAERKAATSVAPHTRPNSKRAGVALNGADVNIKPAPTMEAMQHAEYITKHLDFIDALNKNEQQRKVFRALAATMLKE